MIGLKIVIAVILQCFQICKFLKAEDPCAHPRISGRLWRLVAPRNLSNVFKIRPIIEPKK